MSNQPGHTNTAVPFAAVPFAAVPFAKVAVLMGGYSAEREVSLMSGQGVLQALRASGVNAHAFDPSERPLQDLQREGFDACFIALHGRWGEDGTVQGALELLRIPYTGAGVLACALALDKAMSKRVWQALGLPTPAWHLLHVKASDALEASDTQAIVARLGLPLVVKPMREGSTLGFSKVEKLQDMQAAVRNAARYDSMVLLEAFVSGSELTCCILGAGEQAQAMPVIRIVAPGGNYNYEYKYFSNATQYHIPCGLAPQQEAQIKALACQAYRALDCRGWGRVDIMLDSGTNQPYLLELNTTPGMTSHSLVPKSALAAGVAYPELCLRILGQARLDYACMGAGL